MRRFRVGSILLCFYVQCVLSDDIETPIGPIERLEELGRGSFGVVNKCRVKDTGRNCAIKIELDSGASTVEHEGRVYQILGNYPGIPKMLYSGKCGKNREGNETILILELVGKSVFDQAMELGVNSFSIKTLMRIMVQVLYHIEYIHRKGVLYMDFKPENLSVGRMGQTASIILLDFGLSELYISNRKHRAENPEVIGSPAAGTLRYMSPYAHRHRVISRRDDLISLGYVIVYLSKQKLSWMSQMAEEKPEKSERFLKIKTDTSIENLVGDLPEAFRKFFESVQSLKFNQAPRYIHLRRLFIAELKAMGESVDDDFDWSEPRTSMDFDETAA